MNISPDGLLGHFRTLLCSNQPQGASGGRSWTTTATGALSHASPARLNAENTPSAPRARKRPCGRTAQGNWPSRPHSGYGRTPREPNGMPPAARWLRTSSTHGSPMSRTTTRATAQSTPCRSGMCETCAAPAPSRNCATPTCSPSATRSSGAAGPAPS